LAVTGAEATPAGLVVMVMVPPAKLALAPVVGDMKVTFAPLTGFPPASLTMTASGAAKAVLTLALWPLPLVKEMRAAGPARFVSANVAGVATPEMEAVTE